MPASLLVADDDPVARDLLVEMLVAEGYRVRPADGGEACVRLAEAEPFDLALVDLRMPDLDGLEVLRRLSALRPPVPVLILTAFATIGTAIETIRAGAWDYVSKPFRIDEIRLGVARALEAQRLARENLQYRRQLDARYGVESLVGQSSEMVAIYKQVARLAALDTTILIQGETGTGKELVARAIHQASPRAARPLVVIDCTALPETLFESELFGHERGAFTGASSARRGLLESADGTTCFLDEIGELPRALQVKLLRVLQARVVRRVGGTRRSRSTCGSWRRRTAICASSSRRGRSAKTCTTGSTSWRSRSRRCGSGGATFRCWPGTSSRNTRRPPAVPRVASRGRRWRCWKPIRGPATYASWSTRSSGRWHCRRPCSSCPTSCRPRCGRRPASGRRRRRSG
jgi:CheY-like chemotaxis protein